MPLPVSACVEQRHGRPTLLLNHEPVAPLLYALSDCPGARWTWEEVPSRNIAEFAQRGVRLFQADVWFEQMLTAADTIDVSLAQRQIAGVLAAAPGGAAFGAQSLSRAIAKLRNEDAISVKGSAAVDVRADHATSPAVVQSRGGREGWWGKIACPLSRYHVRSVSSRPCSLPLCPACLAHPALWFCHQVRLCRSF